MAFPPDSFALLSRVRNKPYDVFGCWLTETSLISGNLHRIGDITSCSVLWLNNAFQVQTGTGQAGQTGGVGQGNAEEGVGKAGHGRADAGLG